MSQFIKKISVFIIVIATIYTLIVAIHFCRFYKFRWDLPEQCTTLFMGASHIQLGINPKYYPNSLNIASSSERYLYTYIKVKKILENNPQIDTIFLQFAPTDIWEDADSKYFSTNDMLFFIPRYFPYFSKDEVKIFSQHYLYIIKLLMGSVFDETPKDIAFFGGYCKSSVKFNPDKRYDKDLIQRANIGNSINIEYLHKIINICQTYKCKLFLLYCPMYLPEDYYIQAPYYEYYLKELQAIQLLDYRDLPLPNHFRQDEHHLNQFGAKYLTTLLVDSIRNN